MTDYEYRRDGWPLCPRCGEDELWSAVAIFSMADPLGDLRCYNCNWEGRVPMKPIDLSEFVPPTATEFVEGLRAAGLIAIGADWGAKPPSTNVELMFIGPIKNYAGIVFEGPALGPQGKMNLRVVFPTRDRRKARRVSRLSGLRFRKASDGTFTFGDGRRNVENEVRRQPEERKPPAGP